MPIHLDSTNRLPVSTNPIVGAFYSDIPFINNMDEISYWIYTKRAPCLLKYDTDKNSLNIYNKPISIHTIEDDVLTPKKNKRKLSLLDDGSISTEKQNVYFDVSQIRNQPIAKSHKSEAHASNIDFNIKNSPVQNKRKRIKMQKKSQTNLHKKNKVVTSTPKANVNLRRSLRRQGSLNNNNITRLDSSFEVLHCNLADDINHGAYSDEKHSSKPKKPLQILDEGDQSVNNKSDNEKLIKRPTPNDQFDDLSDVSGFTANYIRSTKMHANKAPRNLRSKTKWNLTKEHSKNLKDKKTIVCVNKSVNTGIPNTSALNCSTSSSQNVVNLVTVKSNKRTPKVNKSTSLLKFIDSRSGKANVVDGKVDTSNDHNPNLDASFQSLDSGTSRYPKRQRISYTNTTVPTSIKMNNSTKQSLDKRRNPDKYPLQHNDRSERKENPDETVVSKTRSGRSIGQTLRQHKNSVLVVSNSVDQSSSVASMNVAITGNSTRLQNGSKTKNRMSTRNMERVKSNRNGTSLRRESLRDRSGFAACFSDSDDSEPLKQKKYFC
ncbi:uncharacterized protein LOC131849446 [Achroia grisella]|uniref:uncharacterized protein LOC131849446 n=1 Tax=Achroia grisella TaxID=688607 RepID=UPI0027D1F522|nr:uncharacterized protein LOC131849446 [Achroia grisella]